MHDILVGLDGSPNAPRVLTEAIALARPGELLHLIRSIGIPAELPQDLWKASDEPLIDILERRAREDLAARLAAVPTAIRGAASVVVGVPWQSICEAARARSVRLIVIGSHGYSGIDHLIGTTAAKVVNHAPCSVLVVRPGKT